MCGPGEFVTQCTVDMARAQKTVKAQTGLSDQVARSLREGALYFFGAVAVILWYALFTYDVNDPSFSQATSTSVVNNGVGRLGAYVSGFLFDFFGGFFYFFSRLLYFFGYFLSRFLYFFSGFLYGFLGFFGHFLSSTTSC